MKKNPGEGAGRVQCSKQCVYTPASHKHLASRAAAPVTPGRRSMVKEDETINLQELQHRLDGITDGEIYVIPFFIEPEDDADEV